MTNPPLKCECEFPNIESNMTVAHCTRCGLPTAKPEIIARTVYGLPPLNITTEPLPIAEPKCCEKCAKWYDDNGRRCLMIPFCNNSFCPCHTPPVEGGWAKELKVMFEDVVIHHRGLPCFRDEIRVGNIELFITTLLHSERERIVKMCEEMMGMSKNPDYFIRLKRRLEGNIVMRDTDDFAFTQISWEAKDLVLNDLRDKLST